MPKSALTIEEQIELLRTRGMTIPDDSSACKSFLETTNYYRFSGYFRYWQVQPTEGRNEFLDGTNFISIKELYVAEQQLITECVRVLRLLELVLRTQFAFHYAHTIGATGVFAEGTGFSAPPRETDQRVEEFIMEDLDRSNEAFINRYRDSSATNDRGQFLPRAYEDLPIWVAVEVFSFGTLSRCIQAADESGITGVLADKMKVARAPFATQVRSFVYLRNRCAHHARIWNHSVLDAPAQNKNIRGRAQKAFGKYDHRSVFTVLVAIDQMLSGAGIEKDWLKNRVWPILDANKLLKAGILKPRKYEDFDPREIV